MTRRPHYRAAGWLGLRIRAGAVRSHAYVASIAKILAGIALNESAYNGRAWPWTLNVAGRGFFFRTREDAYQARSAFLSATVVRDFDVGLMQVNWGYHRQRFAIAVGCTCAGNEHPRGRRHPQRELSQDAFGGEGRGVLPQRQPSSQAASTSRASSSISLKSNAVYEANAFPYRAGACRVSLNAAAASTDPLDFDYEVNGQYARAAGTHLQRRNGHILPATSGADPARSTADTPRVRTSSSRARRKSFHS